MATREESIQYLLSIKPLTIEEKRLLKWKTPTTGQKHRIPPHMLKGGKKDTKKKDKDED